MASWVQPAGKWAEEEWFHVPYTLSADNVEYTDSGSDYRTTGWRSVCHCEQSALSHLLFLCDWVRFGTYFAGISQSSLPRIILARDLLDQFQPVGGKEMP
jgi:hypothetical protein